ncbi:MAG: Exodeoxyribonuclease [Pseudomonadota bacterium]|jgi:exodeoxyribonuclease-3
MKIASWNVNSLRARHDLVLDWLRRTEPDILCMQETKVLDDEFPTEVFQRLGYAVVMCGQKSYNGVAIASRKLMRDIRIGLLDDAPNAEKRLISATVGKTQVFCCYVPNGQRLDSQNYVQKLRWLKQLRATLDAWADPAKDVVVCGDFNIATDARDLYSVEAFAGQTHFSEPERAALEEVKAFGLRDCFRLHESEGDHFTWWDYRGGSLRKNEGLRIDYIFASESLARRCDSVVHDKAERELDKPSDHVPVIAEFG